MASQIATPDAVLHTLCDRVETLLAQQRAYPHQRILIALAGVPGSGKSTICAAALTALASRGISDVAVVPMDGFHYPKATLSTFPDPVLAFRKRGAPFTFDASAFIELIKVLRMTPVTASDEAEIVMAAPSFDHALQDAVADDIRISSRNRIAIIEGNYTLLAEEPWSEIAGLVHERWFVNTPPEVVKQRIVQRHIRAGIETSVAAATARVEDNDIPNGDLIRAKLINPDVTITN